MKAKRNIRIRNKKSDLIYRLNTACNCKNQTTIKEQEDCVIDLTLKALYNNGDRVIKSYYTDILKANNIHLHPNVTERIWEKMVTLGIVNPVIGFGNSGKLTLTNDGYMLMDKFGTYYNFLAEQTRQSQQPAFAFPQIIVGNVAEENDDTDQENVTPEIPQK